MKHFLNCFSIAFVLISLLLSCNKPTTPRPSDLELEGVKGKVKAIIQITDTSSFYNYFDEYGFLTVQKKTLNQLYYDISYQYEKPGVLKQRNIIIPEFPNMNESESFNYILDKDGVLEKIISRKVSSISNADAVEEYEFYPSGTIKQTVLNYSGSYKKYTRHEYDKSGKLVKSVDIMKDYPDDSKNPTITNIYNYDNSDNLIKVTTDYKNYDVQFDGSYITNYSVLRSDQYGNWLKRKATVSYLSQTGRKSSNEYIEERSIEYY